MNTKNRTARRYHWRSDTVRSFVEEPHEAIVGENVGEILNLTDGRAGDARSDLVDFTRLAPGSVVREVGSIRHLELPGRHEVRPSDVVLRRLHAVLEVARDRAPADFAELLLTPGLGPRTVAALALASEVLHGHPSRFHDPARFSFAHGGKDGHPHPVLTGVYDKTIQTLRSALDRARVGDKERLDAVRRLDRHCRRVEAQPGMLGKGSGGVEEMGRRGWKDASSMGGRTAVGGKKRGQLLLPLGKKD
jgi:hypothetical protein